MGASISLDDLNDIVHNFQEHKETYKQSVINLYISGATLFLFLFNIINMIWFIAILLVKDIFWAFYPFHNSDIIEKK